MFDRFDTFELRNTEEGNRWITRKDRNSQFEYKGTPSECQLFDDLDSVMNLHDCRFKNGYYQKVSRRKEQADSDPDLYFKEVQSLAGVFDQEEDQ